MALWVNGQNKSNCSSMWSNLKQGYYLMFSPCETLSCEYSQKHKAIFLSLSKLKFNWIEEMHENMIMTPMNGWGLPSECQWEYIWWDIGEEKGKQIWLGSQRLSWVQILYLCIQQIFIECLLSTRHLG